MTIVYKVNSNAYENVTSSGRTDKIEKRCGSLVIGVNGIKKIWQKELVITNMAR